MLSVSAAAAARREGRRRLWAVDQRARGEGRGRERGRARMMASAFLLFLDKKKK
jgi:hypothetical protein